MKILITSATDFEIRPFLDRVKAQPVTGNQLFTVRFGATEADVLIPGIGMVATACHVGMQLASVSYDLAINTGIAGACRPDLRIGDVVEVTEESLPEMGVGDDREIVSFFSLGLANPDRFPFQGGRLVNLYPVKDNPVLLQLRKVRGSTVNTLRTLSEKNTRTGREEETEVETMEGAAFLYACLCRNTGNVQIRSVSNYVGEQDRSKWDVRTAIRNLNDVLIRFLHTIS